MVFRKTVLIIYLLIIPAICFSQKTIDDIPDKLNQLDKSQFQAANISVYMETCIRTLSYMFSQKKIPRDKSRIGSFQICGCSLDIMRNNFDEKTYLKTLRNKQKVFAAIVDENLKKCTSIYSEYYINAGTPNKIDI